VIQDILEKRVRMIFPSRSLVICENCEKRSPTEISDNGRSAVHSSTNTRLLVSLLVVSYSSTRILPVGTKRLTTDNR
jgi:hypothetical protein